MITFYAYLQQTQSNNDKKSSNSWLNIKWNYVSNYPTNSNLNWNYSLFEWIKKPWYVRIRTLNFNKIPHETWFPSVFHLMFDKHAAQLKVKRVLLIINVGSTQRGSISTLQKSPVHRLLCMLNRNSICSMKPFVLQFMNFKCKNFHRIRPTV